MPELVSVALPGDCGDVGRFSLGAGADYIQPDNEVQRPDELHPCACVAMDVRYADCISAEFRY